MLDPFSLSRVRQADKGEVHSTYEGWPSLARKGFASSVRVRSKGGQRVCFLGMGGSAAGGDIVAGWLHGRDGVDVEVFKGEYPSKGMKDTLAIACSVSGETGETIRMMLEAASQGASVVSMSTGGTLMAESKRLGIPHILMPKVLAPRYALPFIVFSSLAVLEEALDLGSSREAEGALSEMESYAPVLGIKSPTEENPAKKMALLLLEGTPVIYGWETTRGVGVRFKNALNENAKKHAQFSLLPDALHNDIESWEDPLPGFVPIFLRHSNEGKWGTGKTLAMMALLRELGKAPVEVRGRGGSSLSQLVTMAYELDMASYFVAVGLGRDPLAVPMIERLKQGP